VNIPPSLAEILGLAFGPDWRRRAPAWLYRSPRQISRWCSGETPIPRRFLVLMQRRFPDDIEAVEVWRKEQHLRIDEEALERRGELFQAHQWLRGMLHDRPEWEPPPRVGRPRKRLR
jgi:hypothetical protein